MDEEYYYDDQYAAPEGNEVVEEPANYQPPDYKTAWDNPEHFAYEPGYNNETVDTKQGGNYVEGISGNTDEETNGDYNSLGQWQDRDKKESSGDSLRNTANRNNGYSNNGTYRITNTSGSDTTTTTGSSTTRRIPTKNLPIFNGPSLYIPEWDNEKIKRLRQSKANSGVSSLRNLTNRAITFSRSSQSGYGARQSLRESLAGYGTGLSKIMNEADTEAQTEYGREYTAGANKAQNEYNAKFQVANTMYQAALQDYLNSFTTETTNNQTANTQRNSFNNYSYFSA